MPGREEGLPKHRQVYGELERSIRSGRWKSGERLPSESELVRQFGASRITVGRAVRDLQLAGLVDRRAGSGTFVRTSRPAGALSFGLLIPDLGETEIFEPICRGMMASPLAREHALLWGCLTGPSSKEEQALELCRQYVDRKVAGVFFAPLELTPAKDEVNQRILAILDEARIPVVLLDRPAVPYPGRGRHDLVGIDNRRAGLVVTEHLLGLGARRVAFVALPNAAATVDAREAGYREALFVRGMAFDSSLAARLAPADVGAVRAFMESSRPDGIVCANDWTAARLLHSLLALGVDVPRAVRLVGIDDVDYASLLPVPLTTLQQPTRQIGAAALAVMLDRVTGADLPARDVLLEGRLVVRRSCGSP
ncbi:MAG TPA: GntR family transcriptional regulator [Anaeromyxobacteraceae bacterium]|nr:GntR family transcriptional regulator [Anaeromyxobacteraceae bacterium]